MNESSTIASFLTPSNIMFIIGLIGIVITVYKSITNPQHASNQQAVRLDDRVSSIEKAVKEIKETHLRTVEQDIKNLTMQISELSKTVIKLATIIDERIPKNVANPPS